MPCQRQSYAQNQDKFSYYLFYYVDKLLLFRCNFYGQSALILQYGFGKENNQFKMPWKEKLGGIEPRSLLAGFASQIAHLSNSVNSLRSNTRTLLRFRGISNCVFLYLAVKALIKPIIHKHNA